jgi:hypothetical protein
LSIYAEACGWVLARAHAKAGDPWLISGYLGSNDEFDAAMGKFALAYADQAERDHAALKRAVRAGIIDVGRRTDPPQVYIMGPWLVETRRVTTSACPRPAHIAARAAILLPVRACEAKVAPPLATASFASVPPQLAALNMRARTVRATDVWLAKRAWFFAPPGVMRIL